MPSTAYLLRSLRTYYPGRSPLVALADSIGSTLHCMDRVAQKSRGKNPTQPLLWDLYKNVLQTLSGLRQRERVNVPPLPATPANAPPTVLLATIRDWLIQVDGSTVQGPVPNPLTEPKIGSHQRPCTDAQREVWDLLENRAMLAKEISVKLFGDGSREDAIRKRIAAARRAGWRIDGVRGLGYFRPDAPPRDPTGPGRESG